MPESGLMRVLDEFVTHAPPRLVFDIVRAVDRWPDHLPHYRYVRYRERTDDGGGLVEMSANRPFGVVNWPTWWLSAMSVDMERPAIRFHHVGGITSGMDVEWSFESANSGTHIRLLHIWCGPKWPLIGEFAATAVIGPVFIHGIASRTIAGLARAAETQNDNRTQ
jgi:ribosome-associated toxin RatA of RatAB toxin-antitoxin module